MPWKECDRMDERVKFVGRLLEGVISAHPVEAPDEHP